MLSYELKPDKLKRDQYGRFIGQPKKPTEFEKSLLGRLHDLEHDNQATGKYISTICWVMIAFCILLGVCYLRT